MEAHQAGNSEKALSLYDRLLALSCYVSQPENCYEQAVNLHYYGTDVVQDRAMALGIFAKLCETNMGKACHGASLAFNKTSDYKDYNKYIYFQKKGCENDTPESCFLLGRSHEAPWEEGVFADHSKANSYFNRACELDYYLGCQYAKVKATGHRLKN